MQNSDDAPQPSDRVAPRWRTLAQQLLVPSLIAIFAIAYLGQARRLSFAALLFPGMVSAALLAAVAWLAVDEFRLRRKPVRREGQQPERQLLKSISFVVLALLVPFGWSTLGVLPTLWSFVLLVMLLLGERRALLLLLVPAGLAGGIVYLFEEVLGIPL